jgi:MSHA biogenesis protein MshE
LGDMALDYAMQGLTSIEEVIKVSEYLELEEPVPSGAVEQDIS